MSKITPKNNKNIFTDEVLSVLPKNENIKRGVRNAEKGEKFKQEGTFAGKNNPMYGKKPAIAGKSHKETTIEKMSEVQRQTWKNEEVRRKKIEGMNSEDAKKKKNESLKKHWSDPDTYKKRSASNKKSRTTNVRNKISKKLQGIVRGSPSDEHKQKIREKLLGVSKPKMICPHCYKEGAGPIMKRFHFDRCKNKGK